MTKEEKASELRTIRSHMISVMDDLSSYKYRLEDIGCTAESKRLDTVIAKLYELTHKLDK